MKSIDDKVYFDNDIVYGLPVKLNLSNPLLTSVAGACTWVITNALNDPTAFPLLINNSTNEVVNMGPKIQTDKITYAFASSVDIPANTYRFSYIGLRYDTIPSTGDLLLTETGDTLTTESGDTLILDI
jgi:hypothetical protein